MNEPLEVLDDRHAIVTGASRGIGAATAAKLAALGADVTLMSRSRETLEKRCDELETAIGGNYLAVPADVTDRRRVVDAIDEARRQLGPPDILVNNAGAAVGKPFTELSAEDWESMIEVNLHSVFYCTKAVLPEMLERGAGRIINMASTTGLTGYKYVAHYAASKHGVVGLTKSLAKEVAQSGVTVNAVCPGYTETDMVDEGAERVAAKLDKPVDQVKESFKRLNPQGRFVQPDEVASTVAWLCRPEQRAVNGQSIAIDGGETA